MKRALVLFIFLTLAILVIFGCAKSDNSQILIRPVKARPVDADKNGVIEEKDVFVLYDLADKIYDERIKPHLEKSGIDNKLDLYIQGTDFRLRSKLTVIEWEELTRSLDEWSKIHGQIEATAGEAMNKIVEKDDPISKTGKVVSCHVWGPIELADGLVIKYAGIQMPVGGTDNRYSRIVTLLSSKLIYGRLIRYDLTGEKIGNVKSAYVYVNDVCINEELVKRGYALAIRDKSEMSSKFIKLEEEARDKRIGLWAFHPHEKPFAEPLY